jgi:acyl-CoA reductase-like NAD-dependent aldehyde dehydrogenase
VGERFQPPSIAPAARKGCSPTWCCSHEQTERLIGSGAWTTFSFTGSVRRRPGAIERAAAGERSPPSALELGGKDPAYVREDAQARPSRSRTLVDGSFFNSGPELLRHRAHLCARARFSTPSWRASSSLTRKYVVGNPLDGDTTLGPMARANFADHVRGQTEEALRKGRARHIGMQVEGDRPGSPYIAPEVLTNVDHQMAVMREESFGPVVGIMKVRDDDEAVQLMNDSPYGLTASIWTTTSTAPPNWAIASRRDRVRQPLRLSRPRPRLDGCQGHRTRRGAVLHRL